MNEHGVWIPDRHLTLTVVEVTPITHCPPKAPQQTIAPRRITTRGKSRKGTLEMGGMDSLHAMKAMLNSFTRNCPTTD